MSLWITQVETKKKVERNQSISQWYKNLILKIIDLLKYRSVPSTYISKLQNQSLDLNGRRTVISLTSIYQLFKINMTLQISFMIHVQINVKYKITAIDFSLDEKIHIMYNLKYELGKIEKNTPYKIIKNLQNGVKIQQLINHQFDRSLTPKYAEITTQYLLQSYLLCDAMIADLQNQIMWSKPNKEKQEINIQMQAYKGMAMVEKQNTNFKKFYKNQNNGVSFLAKPQEIPDRPNQVLRQLNIQVTINEKEIKSSKQNNSRFFGAHSKIRILQAFGSVIDTYINHRQNKENEEQDPDYKPGLKQGCYKLIGKKPGDDDDSKKSMSNQLIYLKLKGSSPNPYICNYFLPKKKSSQTKGKKKEKSQIPQQTQLYSQYHEQRVFERFHQGLSFTLLDVINFAEQLMVALISFYLNLGYLNRDVKEENILIDRNKVIQIIDHGSIYPYKTEVLQPFLQRQKQLLDSKMRSTIYCTRQMFYQDPYLQAKYRNHTNYRMINSIHRTFDVYSVGHMLEEILSTYDLWKLPKWIEVGQKLKKLTHYMTQKDYQLRIQMQTALQELRSIRKFIYESQTQNQS